MKKLTKIRQAIDTLYDAIDKMDICDKAKDILANKLCELECQVLDECMYKK